MNYPAELLFDIDTLVSTSQASSILWISQESQHRLHDYHAQRAVLNQATEIVCMTPDQIEKVLQLQQRFDLAIVIDCLEHLPKNQGTQLLSRLRDLIAKQYCVALPLASSESASNWQLTDLLALALKRVSQTEQDSTPYGLFKYSIENYKKTPDWLNADNWANPEMWGKYWW